MGRAAHRFALLLLFAAVPLLEAQPSHFGSAAPLANTRYRVAAARSAKLVSTGTNLFLFWQDGGYLRSTKIVEGERRAGRLALPSSRGEFDAVWTGTHFVVIASPGSPGPATRALNAAGDPVGKPVVTGAPFWVEPRLAWNGSSILLLYLDSAIRPRAAMLNRLGSGAVSASDPILGDTTRHQAVASNGSSFAAVTQEAGGVFVTMLDGAGQITARRQIGDGIHFQNGISVAWSGSAYVALWADDAGVSAAEISPAGEIVATALLDARPSGGSFRMPAVVWAGADWAAAWVLGSTSETPGSVQLVRMGARLSVTSRRQHAVVAEPALAVHGGTVKIAWNTPHRRETGPSPAVRMADWPETASPEPVTFKATRQSLQVTATSADATLVIWNEQAADVDGLRAGLRMRTGEWIESALEGPRRTALDAASDGREFVVIAYDSSGEVEALHLDQNGELVRTTALPFHPTDVLWTGKDYVLIGVPESLSIAAARLTPSGGLSEVIRAYTSADAKHDPRIATDGSGYFAAFGIIHFCPVLCLGPDGLRGVRLGADLRAVGPEIDFTNDAYEYDLATAGKAYLVAWSGERQLSLAVIPGSGGAPRVTALDTKTSGVQLLPLGEGAAIRWWRLGESSVEGRIGFLDRNGDVSTVVSIPAPGPSTRLAALPDGRPAYVAAPTIEAAPQHGAQHLVMAVGDAIPLGPPEPSPRLTPRLSGRNVVLEWEPSPSAVNGYRVEYRVADGSWNELEAFFAPEERTAYFTAQPGRLHEFRVRAFADGGTSDYTATAIYAGRRRSVR